MSENDSSVPGPAASLPGAGVPSPALTERLRKAVADKGPDYRPRTRHLNDDGSARYTNRLILESSPYLLQHAHNPVNWYRWGDEAFETARRLGRPVLLSIGYSTCHWCHVMEEESFEDEEIARYINEHYVAIKVDREERPDVDAIYMTAVQALTGRGGWPMTVWLTADRKPFYGGTYFPARDGDRGTPIGFLTLLQRIRTEFWDAQPEQVANSAEQLAQAIRQNLAPTAPQQQAAAGTLHDAVTWYRRGFDSTWGGMNAAPKFPSSLPVRLLLRYHRRTGEQAALDMAVLTLRKMAAGGMYDQAGGGFHRYSTDIEWLVPHFEKMLYDNALLTMAYLEGYQATGDGDFARVAREILRYVERDMTSPEGAFYSATDADSLTPSGHREEGWFFTWTPQELARVLGPERAKIAGAYYGVTEAGNFEGRNILHVARPHEAIAAEFGLSPAELRAKIDETNEILYAARAERPAPLRDEKILTAWNGLMIGALARAALILGEEEYAHRAARAADFVLTQMRNEGRLLRSYMDGRAAHNGYLDDYAFLIAGLIDLYEATRDLRWLEEAIAIDRVLEARYEDEEGGGFFMTSDDHERLLAREKPNYDGAEPSGNSVQALNLLRLAEFTTDDRYRQRAARTLGSFGAQLARAPSSLSEMLLALDFELDRPKEVILVAPSGGAAETELFLSELRRQFLPNRVLSIVTEGEQLERQQELIPLLRGKTARDGRTTAYVCEGGICKLPTGDPAKFAEQLGAVAPLERPEGDGGP
jgi:uncharacterized protein YyaL (SSP411 family)